MTMRCSARLNLGAFAAVLLNHSGSSLVSSFGLFHATQRSIIFRSIVLSRVSSSLFSSSSSLSSADMELVSSNVTSPTLKVLALHGSGGTAEEFPKRLEALDRTLLFHTSESANLKLEITSVQAPFVKENGFSWWTMPPGVRSFNAKEYTGFEESATKVLDVWETGGFDVVLGHSQGAILVGALLALKRAPYHPPGGYIMNGVSFPNPYSQNLESLKDDDNGISPRILFLLGKCDKIAPNPTGEKLRDLLGEGGFDVSSCYHEGGHGFPEEDVDDQSMKTIVDWILEGRQ